MGLRATRWLKCSVPGWDLLSLLIYPQHGVNPLHTPPHQQLDLLSSMEASLDHIGILGTFPAGSLVGSLPPSLLFLGIVASPSLVVEGPWSLCPGDQLHLSKLNPVL